MAEILIRVLIKPAREFANKGEHDKETAAIAREFIKTIERHGFKLADVIYFDTLSEKKRGEGAVSRDG